ncbi:hypothetical protein GIB67_001908 [Kingdonia uniflora]|uniref:Tryptophan synthase beta chain-like PALP domain-containing protein n=1 Tax=Kingdonia uniflora TaxID=39325 RepID=A0A7J7NUJ6_9MAGN|nr:hypothetical protein GIB67_001908 [Kingdonia uniflora]
MMEEERILVQLEGESSVNMGGTMIIGAHDWVGGMESVFGGTQAEIPSADPWNESWRLVETTANAHSGPLLILGDFNTIFENPDKVGGKPLRAASSTFAREVTQQAGLIDLGFSGHPFTWNNKRRGKDNIKERLDRSLANADWMFIFPTTKVFHFPALGSDHSPLCLDTYPNLNSLALPFTDATANREPELLVELDETQLREEMFWRQKLRVNWLTEGDRNTKFFHMQTLSQRKKNSIDWFRDESGSWTGDPSEIGQIFLRDMARNFQTSNPVDVPEFIHHFGMCITEEDNSTLTRVVTPEEIKFALDSIGPYKAPGPDGFPALFFQQSWEFWSYSSMFLRQAITFTTTAHPINKTQKLFQRKLVISSMDVNDGTKQGFGFLAKKHYVPPSWALHLNPVPSHTFSLAHVPTPIHKWDIPNLPKNTELWIKRDDLSGMQLSGNKVRKLEFLMADAVAQGADCIVTIGGIQSNHCRATAVAAKYLNLDCYLILRTSKALVDKDPGLTGNLLVERLVGAHVDLVSKEEYSKIGSVALTNLLKESLQSEGRKPYVIPVGGSNSIGTW